LQDQKKPDGVHGMRQEKIAIMPMQAGTYILPEIDIDWWNTATEQTEHATLSARAFTVVAARIAPSAVTLPPPRLQQSEKIAAPASNPTSVTQSVRSGVAEWWRWLAVIATIGWLLTLAYIAYLRKSDGARQIHVTNQATYENCKHARKAGEAACNNNDAKACEQALLKLARIQFRDTSIHSLSALAHYCDDALKSEVLKLEQLLYASGTSEWQGDALMRFFRRGAGVLFFKQHQSDIGQALPKLYPD